MFETIKSYASAISQYLPSGSINKAKSALDFFYSTTPSEEQSNKESTNNDNQQQLQVTNSSNSNANYYFQQATSLLPKQVTSLLSETLKFGSSFKVNGQLANLLNFSLKQIYSVNGSITDLPTQTANGQIDVEGLNPEPEAIPSVENETNLDLTPLIDNKRNAISSKNQALLPPLIKIDAESQNEQVNLEKPLDDANLLAKPLNISQSHKEKLQIENPTIKKKITTSPLKKLVSESVLNAKAKPHKEVGKKNTVDDTSVTIENNWWLRQSFEKTGYTLEMLVKISQVVEEHKFIYGIRPLNPIAAKQLGDNNYAAKPMCIKGKSTLNGPCAGMIPFDQSLSKVAEKDISKYNSLNMQAINDGKATAVPCKISFEWLNQLISNKKLVLLNIKDFCVGNQLDFNIFEKDDLLVKWENNNKLYFAVLRKNKQSNYITYLLDKETNMINKTPLQVMGSKDQKIIVADIDSCFYMANRNSFDPNGKDAIQAFRLSKGITNERSEHFRLKINTILGYEAIMHGPDVFNPNTEPKDNYPMTIFIPKKIALKLNDKKINNQEISQVFIAYDSNQLVKLFKLLKVMGFEGYFNNKWHSQENNELRKSTEIFINK